MKTDALQVDSEPLLITGKLGERPMVMVVRLARHAGVVQAISLALAQNARDAPNPYTLPGAAFAALEQRDGVWRGRVPDPRDGGETKLPMAVHLDGAQAKVVSLFALDGACWRELMHGEAYAFSQVYNSHGSSVTGALRRDPETRQMQVYLQHLATALQQCMPLPSIAREEWMTLIPSIAIPGLYEKLVECHGRQIIGGPLRLMVRALAPAADGGSWSVTLRRPHEAAEQGIAVL